MCDGWLTPRNILPFPYSPHTVRSSVYSQRRRACHRVHFWRLLLCLGIQVFALNPGNILASFSLPLRRRLLCDSKAIWADIRGSRFHDRSLVEVRRGEPVKCLSHISNYVPLGNKGSACWGHHSRPAPSEHCIKVVKHICLVHKKKKITQMLRTSFCANSVWHIGDRILKICRSF